jgi:hypothetical protein
MSETSCRKRVDNKYCLEYLRLAPELPPPALSDLQAFQTPARGRVDPCIDETPNKIERRLRVWRRLRAGLSFLGNDALRFCNFRTSSKSSALPSFGHTCSEHDLRMINSGSSLGANMPAPRRFKTQMLRKVRSELGKNNTVGTYACLNDFVTLPCGTY